MPSVVKKQPAEKKAVFVSFSRELEDGDALDSVSLVKISPNSMVATGSVSGRKARVVLESGFDGTSYLITVRVLTTGGRVYEKETIVIVEDTI